MPYCRKCNPGEYNPLYNQIHCELCPHKYTSLRGAIAKSDCFIGTPNVCANRMTCGLYGKCSELSNGLYYCKCESGYYGNLFFYSSKRMWFKINIYYYLLYLGSHCEHKINHCLSSPCYNKAQCISLENTFKCLCTENFIGQYCEIEKTLCDSIECENLGNCSLVNNEPTCECKYGFKGDYCEQKVDYCDNESHCENNSTCISHMDGYVCKCNPGFIGRRCHLRPCDYMPCPQNSTCVDVHSSDTTRNSYR